MQSIVNSPLTLARALQDARRRRGFTQQQLARRAGIGQPTLSNFERGHTRVSLDTLMRILAALDLDLLVCDRATTDPGDAWEDS